MQEEGKRECDPDDVVCQMEVLRHLEGLEGVLGNERFLEKYPELGPLKERLPEEIVAQKNSLQRSIDGCVGSGVEELPEEKVTVGDLTMEEHPEGDETEVEE